MSFETLDVQVAGSVARVTLNRPDVHNAMSELMVAELLDYFTSIREDYSIRAVVLGAAGKSFCAGGDIKDMRTDTPSQTRLDKLRGFEMMLRAVNEAPQVTIARVQGAAMGGGLGLVCVSDIAIAGEHASFGMPEVRLGLAPAVIAPYVITRMGFARTRQMMLTGRRFDAAQALAYGLVHETCAADELDMRVNAALDDIMQCSPYALAKTKQLLFYVQSRTPDESLTYRADLLMRLQDGEDGQEGLRAFIEKRKPRWADS